MLPILHPLSKTSIELRRAINRLHVFKDQNADDAHIEAIDTLMNDLKEARRHIPKEFLDPDLKDE